MLMHYEPNPCASAYLAAGAQWRPRLPPMPAPAAALVLDESFHWHRIRRMSRK